MKPLKKNQSLITAAKKVYVNTFTSSTPAKLSVQILGSEYANRHIIITGPDSLLVKSLLSMIADAPV